MDIPGIAHFAVLRTVNAMPGALLRRFLCRSAAGAQISVILLMNIGGGVGLRLTAAHHFFGDLRRNVKIKHQSRLRQLQQAVLKVKKPLQKCLALPFRKLARLMHGIGGRIAVSDQNAAAFVVFAPILLIGRIAVDREKGRGGISVHSLRMRAVGAVKIFFKRRRGWLAVARKGQGSAVKSFLLQTLQKELALRRFAGAVRSLKYDQFTLAHLFLAPTTCTKNSGSF